jgi:hypothetical protein
VEVVFGDSALQLRTGVGRRIFYLAPKVGGEQANTRGARWNLQYWLAAGRCEQVVSDTSLEFDRPNGA